MSLIIENLTKTYSNKVKALDNLSLKIGKGMFGLLGPNGAGKSTLMRTIATLQSPDTGSIRFNDINVIEDQISLRKTLGYLPQSFGVYPNMSADELLNYFAKLKGISDKNERKALIEKLLEITNLTDVKKKNVSGYSGGMKQRFGIAQALIGDPKLIIVDEPTAGLDPMERNRFHNLLSEIGENVVVILSTHIVDDVRDLCNDMAIILDGEVKVMGEPINLIKALNGKVWKGLVNKKDVPKIEQATLVFSSKLPMGKVHVRLFSDTHIAAVFEKVDA